MAVLDDILYSCFSVLYIKQVEDHAKKNVRLRVFYPIQWTLLRSTTVYLRSDR